MLVVEAAVVVVAVVAAMAAKCTIAQRAHERPLPQMGERKPKTTVAVVQSSSHTIRSSGWLGAKHEDSGRPIPTQATAIRVPWAGAAAQPPQCPDRAAP